MGPMELPLTFEAVSFEPNKMLTWKSVSNGDMQWKAEYLLEPHDGGTRVRTTEQLSFSGHLAEAEAEGAGEIGEAEQQELLRFSRG